MSTYTEAQNAIRAARLERDNARLKLYTLLLQQLKLLRSQKKSDRQETIADPAVLAEIATLRNQINADLERIRQIEESLRAPALIEQEMKRDQAQLDSLMIDFEKLQAALRQIEAELNNAELDPQSRATLEVRHAELLKQLNALRTQIKLLNRKIADDQEKLQALREQSASLEKEKSRLNSEIGKLQEQINHLTADSQSHGDPSGVLEEIAQQIAEQRQVVNEREKLVGALIGRMFGDLSPQRLVEEWSDNTPIILLPLRLETRFKQTEAGQELWVRVFPDEVAVTNHEKILTDSEYQSGLAYWKALRSATKDDARKTAWKTLADKSGANRAAWVALQTKPLNWSSPPPASDDDLQFPTLEVTKPDNWSEAPHSLVMPDRFVLMAYRNGAAVHTLVGSQISDKLVLGPAPLEDSGNPSITRDPIDNRLKYGEDFQWVTDFPQAVSSGMAFRVPLNADESSTGFDQLLVLGLKLSTDETDSQKLIEELIDNHHYSAKGFSLVRQGTATNNSDNNSSNFSSEDWLHDVSYFVESGDPLFTQEIDPIKATDGQRLAEYLGINYEPLQHVSNSNATDRTEAVAMNRALFAGTLGYYLQSMLNEVMSSETIEKLRNFFTEDVTGRGPLPSIRIGNQPYGILLTSAFSKWAYPTQREFGKPIFDEHVRRVVLYLVGQWQLLQSDLGFIGKSNNARADLMSVLGLQPGSADFYQRIGYSYDQVRNLEQFAWGGKYGEDILLMMFEKIAGRQFLKSFGYNQQHDDGTPKPVPLLFQLIYQHYHTRLDNRNLIDNLPLSEERLIKSYNETSGKNYIHWLFENSSDVDKLEKQDFGTDVPKPNALLYMMLHNSMLLEANNSIRSLLDRHEIVANELIRSRKFMNISTQPDVSHWEVFRAPANRIIPNEVSDRPLLEFVQFKRFTQGTEAGIGQHLGEVKDALNILSNLPTARLERLLVEHIDTLNYRLDSWQMALFDRRLQQQRGLTAGNKERRMGIYLGSYGYLEIVHPSAQRRVKLSEERSLPVELRENKDNLYYSPGNGGYVHTPSVNHATAAAILRNGYLTHASPEERDKLAVNLSSDRVRRAMYLIDGVRNGQSLEQLLGYLFERGLHDWTTRPVSPIILDQFKPNFRRAFPIKKTKLPRQGHNEPAEVIEDYSVVNGFDLAQTTKAFPYGVTDLPALSSQQISAIQQEKKNIENSLDALRDVLTAECAYQLALGNFERAAAVMQAVSGGHLPVEIEVIRSSRGTDLSFTNRVAIHFDPGLSTNPWPPIPLTRRARTEPGFNHWAGELLGDPATIKCTVRAVDTDGNTLLDASNNPLVDTVSLADLAIQPLDFVYIIRNQVEASGYSELESRVRYYFAQKKAVSDETIVKIEFANPGSNPSMKSFAEILPFANAIREMAGKARPLQAQDFKISSKTVSSPSDNPGNIDVGELQIRAAGIRSDFDLLFSQLETAVNNADVLKTEVAVNSLRNELSELANAGFVNVLPFSMFGFADAQREALITQSHSLLDRYQALKTKYDDAVLKVNAPTTKPQQKASLLIELVKSFFGDDFAVLPKFNFTDPADVLKAHTNRDQLLDYALNIKHIPLPVEEWLHGVSLVRPNMHTFNTVLLLSQTFNLESPSCSPLQLPYKDKDTWLSVEFPEDTAIVHDTLAILQCLPQGFQPAGLQCGLLIDEWTESFPRKEEVTGIAFNYDQPNSAPPSAILLAVTPVETGNWKWENLIETILDTIERAKLRAVEPDMIEKMNGFATLLPSTIAEFSTSESTISLDYSQNLKFIYEKVAQLSAAAQKG